MKEQKEKEKEEREEQRGRDEDEEYCTRRKKNNALIDALNHSTQHRQYFIARISVTPKQNQKE